MKQDHPKQTHTPLPWIGTIAAVLALAITAGTLLHRPPPADSQPEATVPTHAEADTDRFLVAVPQYPSLAAYPSDYASDHYEQYCAWKDSRRALWDQPDGYADSLDSYFAALLPELLKNDRGSNKACSPLNIYMALAMLAEITDGNSRKQVTDLLGVSSLSALKKKNAALWNGVYIDDGLTSSRLGNSLWLDSGRQDAYNADTVDRLAEYYYASVYEGQMGSADYDRELQKWVNQQTDGLLKNHVQGLKFTPNTKLALVSTLCFKAGWVGEFSKYSTKKSTFYGFDGKKLMCDFMNTSEKTTAYFGNNFTAVSKELDDGSFKMTFFLPNEDSSVDEVIRDSQMVGLLEDNTSGIRQRNLMVNMSIPKFDVSVEYPLDEGLKALGVTDIFDVNKSDFSGIMRESDGLFASASHAVRVKVDEEGAEGAAYTYITVAKGTAKPQQEEKLDFILDRPFVFAITGPGNTILFAGVIENP